VQVISLNESLSENACILLAYIKEHPGLTQTDIIECLGMYPSQVVTAILELEENALVQSHVDSIDHFTTILKTYYLA
jgi:DNA-binding MarR family transcriptional regulator